MFNVIKSCSGIPEGAVYYDGWKFHCRDGKIIEPADDAVFELYNPRYGIDVCTEEEVG